MPLGFKLSSEHGPWLSLSLRLPVGKVKGAGKGECYLDSNWAPLLEDGTLLSREPTLGSPVFSTHGLLGTVGKATGLCYRYVNAIRIQTGLRELLPLGPTPLGALVCSTLELG